MNITGTKTFVLWAISHEDHPSQTCLTWPFLGKAKWFLKTRDQLKWVVTCPKALTILIKSSGYLGHLNSFVFSKKWFVHSNPALTIGMVSRKETSVRHDKSPRHAIYKKHYTCKTTYGRFYFDENRVHPEYMWNLPVYIFLILPAPGRMAVQSLYCSTLTNLLMPNSNFRMRRHHSTMLQHAQFQYTLV